MYALKGFILAWMDDFPFLCLITPKHRRHKQILAKTAQTISSIKVKMNWFPNQVNKFSLQNK